MQHIRDDLGTLRGSPITDAELNASIAVYNDNRRAVRDLYAYRAAKPWQAPTSEVYLLLRAGMVLPVEEHTRWCASTWPRPSSCSAPSATTRAWSSTAAFCEQPPLALIKSIEMSGCYIVDDDFMLVTRWLLTTCPPTATRWELSKAFLHRSASTAAKYDATREEKGVFLMKQVKTRGAEGVIFAAPSFCDPALLERPMLQDVLAKHGIPHTAFKYAENTGQMAPIREQAGTFADSIKLWNALHEHPCLDADAARQAQGQEAAERPEGRRDVAAEGADQQELHGAGHARENNRKVAATFVPGQPERAADVLRLRAQPARDQRAAERHAQEERQDDHGRRARRPERGRLHLRQGRPGHDDGRRGRPDRRPVAAARHPAAELHRLLHLHEVVRADPPQVRLRDRDAARALPGRRQDRAQHARLRGQAAEGDRDPDARARLGRQVRHRPPAPVHARIGQGRGRPGHVLQSAKNRPSPIDGYFGAVYYIGPIFTAFRGTPEATEYYRMLRGEIDERVRLGKGPVTPDGDMGEEKYRLVVEGPPNWTSFREFWKMFYEEGAVVVSSTYAKVGGLYDFGFRHDPDHPLESLAEYCLGCYTNLNLPGRVT
jgi:benzoyl-CoA reductase/2-hydroxyglutaryl-CoA dehydratase subunit BcrC/BadD/HgdB